jgi:calcineurin-like phosphoesterase
MDKEIKGPEIKTPDHNDPLVMAEAEIKILRAELEQLKKDYKQALRLAKGANDVIATINHGIKDHYVKLLKEAGIEVPEIEDKREPG